MSAGPRRLSPILQHGSRMIAPSLARRRSFGGESVQHAGDGATCRASSRRLWDRADVADAAGRYDQPVTKDELLAHCLSRPGAWQDEPWEGDTVVKVGPKIFAFLGSGRRRDARERRRQVRRQPRRGRRVAQALPGRRLRHALHRSIRVEHPAFRRRDPRRRGARRGRRVLPNDRGQAAEERPPGIGATRKNLRRGAASCLWLASIAR